MVASNLGIGTRSVRAEHVLYPDSALGSEASVNLGVRAWRRNSDSAISEIRRELYGLNSSNLSNAVNPETDVGAAHWSEVGLG